jgi:hypothetical protein
VFACIFAILADKIKKEKLSSILSNSQLILFFAKIEACISPIPALRVSLLSTIG